VEERNAAAERLAEEKRQEQRQKAREAEEARARKAAERAVVGKTAIFEPFIYKMHYFTKTGSGQT
jgi:hypothetical protein